MADIETLPLDQLPDPAVTKRAAEWEQTFKRPATTNLAQRYWENQATAAHTANQLTRADAALQERLMTDQTAQNYFFKAQELPMDLERHNADMEFRREKFEHDKAMFPITIAARKAATIAAMGRTEAMAKANLWKEELHAQEAKDTVGFTEVIRQSGLKRGTPEFRDALSDARLKFPAMDHTLFQDVWKTHAGSELDPDEALKRFAAVQKALPGATVSGKLPGNITVTDRPEPDTTARDQARLSSRLSRLESLRMGKPEDKLSADQKKYLDEQITKIEAHLNGGSFADSAISDTGSQPQADATSPAAPTTTAAPVANPNQAALDWIAANPTDPRAAAIKAKLGLK